jgi:hypothetical protein
MGMQSAFTNVSVFDSPYLEALFGGSEFPDGELMVDKLDEIKEFQKIFMEEVAKIRSHNMFTFPVLSISLLRKDGKFQDEDNMFFMYIDVEYDNSEFLEEIGSGVVSASGKAYTFCMDANGDWSSTVLRKSN